MTDVTANYMDGRVQYRRPQAILLSNNPGTLKTSWVATGKTAVLNQGSTTVLVLNDASDLYVGQTVEVTSGTGEFGAGAKIQSIVGKTITLTVANQTAGSIVFRAGSTSYVPNGQEFVDFIILSDHNRSQLDFKPQRIEKRERMVNGRMRSYHIADKQTLSVSWDNLPSRAFPTAPTFDPVTGKPNIEPYTVDGGAAGNDLLNWYEEHVGSFWVYLAYDKYQTFGTDANAYGHMNQYNQVLEMYISDFSHTVDKRGGLFDLWNVSMSLEEA